ncbi:MAG: hypothetical protein A3J55_00760 [Candidatus Ryanbacteria bacterium RIFCSPHIGHO2_02_FULL_45_17b]|uniref:Uncharacterized protein n=1 Tax=Candidatus Ryanbacteria bacterium RIFCSPHIGHO2_01_FULL_45_22 TaxID=1802114 RepID=A0A1G2G0W1_9BACT|nr:MAG: hypothetical protein A2719_03225 [Candidatus Ryanbacteria bacterium RIFCSPHIGHO2_01_FULL_45_22]OGZ47074.1 MAG: hypothetical protein A3J55_00760 [Candidatus Ryanbacteria bacterium RIFCSPHIGHO2_02_FULL_45_17b]
MISVSPFLYAEAFRKALSEGASEEELVRNLSRAVLRHGQGAQWPRIAMQVSKELVHHRKGTWVTVETARPLTDTQRKKIGEVFSKKDYIEEQIRPDLIAGMRIIVDGEREFDGSLKRKLHNLL